MDTKVKTSVGQVVTKILIEIDGVTIPVVPIQVAAKRMGYSHGWLRAKCNSYELIAIKICGLWFVHEGEIERQSQTVGLLETG